MKGYIKMTSFNEVFKMKSKAKNYILWALTFTKKVIVLVTITWFLQIIFSAILIWYSIESTGNFSYLDTFISDNGETFRLIVGAYTVSKTVENVFKYNEGGVFGTKVRPEETQEISEPEIEIPENNDDDEAQG